MFKCICLLKCSLQLIKFVSLIDQFSLLQVLVSFWMDANEQSAPVLKTHNSH
jgi:hypothetical protein